MSDYYIEANSGYLEAACTVDTGTEVLTCNGHGLSNDDVVTFFAPTTLMAGLTMGNTYYVVNKDTNTFQVSTSVGGGAVDITSSGTGTQYVAKITGAGTSGSPWVGYGSGVIQYALRQGNLATWAATGNRLFLSNVAAFTLKMTVKMSDLATSGTKPFAFLGGWDNGGSITVSTPMGELDGAEINGNDAVASIFALAPDYKTNLVFSGLKLHSTTSYIAGCYSGWTFLGCEIYDGATALISGTNQVNVLGCTLRDDGGSNVAGISGLGYGVAVIGNRFSGLSGDAVTAGSATFPVIIGNVVRSCSGHGFNLAGSEMVIGNTIDGLTVASKYGIYSASGAAIVALSNLITNWAGTSGKAINLASSSLQYAIGNNATYGNTGASAGTPAVVLVDVTESSDPYTDRTNNDLSLAATASSIGAGWLKQFFSADPNWNIGAFQSAPGGGSGTVALPQPPNYALGIREL